MTEQKESTKKYKVWAAVAVIMTIATIVLAVLYGLSLNSVTEAAPTDPEICETEDCITAASRILNAMNQTADPCEDFYQYACGNWIQNHIIASDQSSVSTFNGLRDDVSAILKREHICKYNNNQMYDFVESDSDSTVCIPPIYVTKYGVLETEKDGERESIVKAKSFYNLCLDTGKIDSSGADPAVDIIANAGGWPVVGDAFDAATFQFETTLANFRSKFSTYAIISSWVSADDMISTANILQIDQPSLGMPNLDYYLKDSYNKSKQGYRTFMIDFMTEMGKAKGYSDVTNIVQTVDQIIAFETELAGSMAPASERRDSLAIYKKFTIAEMGTNVTDTIQWIDYVQTMFSKIPGAEFTPDTNVVTYAPEYLKNVTAIINNRWELVQNYLVWRIMKDRISYMSSGLRATYATYRQAVSGTTSEEARWKTCSDTTNSYFPMPVGSLFVTDAFPEANKVATVQMVEDIRTVFKELLPGNDWMDDTTKAAAATKADQIRPIIAYPDYIVDPNDKQMDEDYKAAVVSGVYLETVQNLIEFNEDKSLTKITKEVDFDEWITGPAIVNAFYSPSRNQIVFPAGILQPPFYDAGQPTSMNYGGIGMVIGHEITHGFDDSGAQFDGSGNLNDWWTDFSKENFKNKSQCMVDQYSAISWEEARDQHINGELTLGENIADNGGLRQTYLAYKKWQEVNPKGDLRLPGLSKFTQDQLLFIGYAQVWCSKYTEEYAVRLLTTDSHSPGEYRVVVPSQNFEEFENAFNCRRGVDAMAPDHTCRVW